MIEVRVELKPEQQEAIKKWIAKRTEVIHERVTAADVLQRNGVTLRYGGTREEQFSCPFHGKDTKPSARAYPSDGDNRSHVWCFVCQESWDCISLWKKFGDFERFGAALRDMEREYGILIPEAPSDIKDAEEATEKEDIRQEFLRLLASCDSVLIRNQRHFDMTGYLQMGSILDKLLFQFNSKKISAPRGIEVIHSVFAKIAEKASLCPDG